MYKKIIPILALAGTASAGLIKSIPIVGDIVEGAEIAKFKKMAKATLFNADVTMLFFQVFIIFISIVLLGYIALNLMRWIKNKKKRHCLLLINNLRIEIITSSASKETISKIEARLKKRTFKAVMSEEIKNAIRHIQSNSDKQESLELIDSIKFAVKHI